MSLLSLQLQPVSTSHYYISGDVTIQAGVAIAPGVLLQADPNSQIVIKTGACIGLGSVVHAHNGRVEIGEGANIGAEVLLVGTVTIGGNACIGAATTIFNSSVNRGQMVPPGSLIGDNSRQVEELQATDTVIFPENGALGESPPPPSVPSAVSSMPEAGTLSKPADPAGVNVYGQVYVNQLLVKMFPHHRINHASNPNPLPGPDDPWAD